MAVAEPKADVPGITRPMTYEEYISGPEEIARYDILDGWKVYRLYGDNLAPSPTRRHQIIALNVAEAVRRFQRVSQTGQTLIAPCDVEITYQPLKCCQPDLLFISGERLAQNAPSDVYDPLAPATFNFGGEDCRLPCGGRSGSLDCAGRAANSGASAPDSGRN